MPRKVVRERLLPWTSELIQSRNADPSHTLYLLLCVCALALAVAAIWLGVSVLERPRRLDGRHGLS